ncbi:PTS system mannose/fructose/N-acetylgalactosamine-transporter subunit IIB [Marinilactibacillus psychrotolerans]|uniref:PTS system mannose-specific EIIAB component n=1 Tax=Marinilactibacillus psychrotolerans TaxID=191770 RepID=A0AAV3WQJ7_9LACT|nr:PTS sugar transporter subunit IIB [Marinilactibacillus psychrotolerans]GEL67605.1 PTS sugar transporter [Marinilactibacillus psychrotolerans]GEQ35511.1 PTS system mannose-specific EIIAB component [Marinilactibacillus psychrotolerans]SDD07807.1 PTS system, mannose-specific IIB component [Marinilactibacillus psychrotolerans]
MPIVLTRIDFRMIHGQVITQWVKRCDANEIIAVDTSLSKDIFMQEVFKMAAPKGVNIKIMDVDKAIKSQLDGNFEHRKVLLLFKTVQQLYEAVQKGLELKDVQVGGLGGGPDRKSVNNAITLNQEDADWLIEIENKGIEVYLQTTPDYPSMKLEDAVKKL